MVLLLIITNQLHYAEICINSLPKLISALDVLYNSKSTRKASDITIDIHM